MGEAVFARLVRFKIWPRDKPRMVEPPRRSKSRRVSLRFASHRSVQRSPGIRNIGLFGLRMLYGRYELALSHWSGLTIKEKGWRVNQRPGEILCGGEALVSQLFRAQRYV